MNGSKRMVARRLFRNVAAWRITFGLHESIIPRARLAKADCAPLLRQWTAKVAEEPQMSPALDARDGWFEKFAGDA